MNEAKHRKFAGGWLRVFWGVLQMFLAGGGDDVLRQRPQRLVGGLAAAALLAVIISRILYRNDSRQGGKSR
jgi:hypothetical protein